jgi:hypothetical protein
VGFNASAAVQFEQDFKLDGSTMYVYFRPIATTAKRFDLLMSERIAQPGALGAMVVGADPQSFVQQVGDGLFARELGKGFTVIRQSDGEVRFSAGLLPVGQLPPEPFERKSSKRFVATNERVELHQEQRDFVGPIEVDGNERALYLTIDVEGAPGVDIEVVPRSVGDVWIQSYLTSPSTGPSPAPPLFDDAVANSSGPPYRRLVRVPKGSHYLVIDHSSTAGRTNPPSGALDDRAAMVSVGVEVGDAP